MKKKGLGKGLGGLFPDSGLQEKAPETRPPNGDGVQEIKLSSIEPDKNQPRKSFDKASLNALSESIKQHGVIQPIIVIDKGKGFYGIIAGERRWRAAKLAGLKTIPAIVRDYEKHEAAEIALIENLQREDLNPIETANGYRALMDDFDLTQDEVSERIGKSRSAIANTLRLLTLDKKTLSLVSSGKLSSGHARALIGVKDSTQRVEIANRIINEDLSVRQTEAIVSRLEKPTAKTPPKQIPKEQEIELLGMEERLSNALGTKVSITHRPKGKITIDYSSYDDLDRIMACVLKGKKGS